MTTQANDIAAMFAAFVAAQGVTSVTEETEGTVITATEARAKRKADMTINKSAMRADATAAVEGDSLAALRLSAAKASVSGAGAVKRYADALTAKYGEGWPAIAKAFNPKAPDARDNLGPVLHGEREAFIGACKEAGSSRPVGRVYWSRVIQAADASRGTKEPKALAIALREVAENGCRKLLNAEREGHKLSMKEGKVLSHFLDVAKLLGTDLEALRSACAKPRTVGVRKAD